MADVARRSALKMLAAIPIAGPVAVKEAAAKMGMGSLLGGGAAIGDQIEKAGYGYGVPSSANIGDANSMVDWLRSQAERVFTDQNVSIVRKSVIRSGEARVLDADLASLRSASPSSAYHIQIERCVARRLESEQQSWLERIRDHSSIASAKQAATSIY